ncbi:MAG: hypothetical protein H0V92_05835 [Pseudonocardiales bacterium]|nr:hypothetical protein [Pseudonocardiales bacterium]
MTVKEKIARFLGLSDPAADDTEAGPPEAVAEVEGTAEAESTAPETEACSDATASPDAGGAKAD